MNRQLYMGGGIMNAMPREQYGLGSSLKKAVKSVGSTIKKVADPIAQIAAVVPNPYQPYAQAYTGMRSAGVGGDYKGLQIGNFTPGAYGGKYGVNPFATGNMGQSGSIFQTPGFGQPTIQDLAMMKFPEFEDLKEDDVFNKSVDMGETRRKKDGILGTMAEIGETLNAYKNIISLAAAGTLAGLTYKEQQDLKNKLENEFNEYKAEVAKYTERYKDPSNLARYEVETPDELKDVVRAPVMGGGIMNSRMRYAMGDTASKNAMQAAALEGLPLRKNPKGIMELDLREESGFIPPVGIKEKEDDIPAMLSNNEFVFTADAVRGMGDGDVEKGSERMYALMKELEEGGRV